MIQATPDITAQLVRIKHTFQSATTFATRPDPASRVVATILMDYVAESALKTVYWTHPATAPTAREVTFPELVRAVAALTGTPPTLPLQSEIGNLHRQRNDTQHRNLVPSAEDVPRHAAYVEAFLRDLFTRFFAVDFDTLSLSALVSHDELREHLAAAERLIAEHEYAEAAAQSALATSKALQAADDLLKVPRDPWFNPTSISYDAEHAGLTRPQASILGDMAETISRLRDELDERIRVLALGLDYSSYIKYKAAAPLVRWTINGSSHVLPTKDICSPEEAVAIFDYALNHILRLEAMGALPGPAQEE